MASLIPTGLLIQLPGGAVHYELCGAKDGQPVILIPGFSTPLFIWDPTIAALASAELRVLRYDLYGRGFSDKPNVVYDFDLYDHQLLNLLTALKINQPVDLIGLSMGGRIAVIFTARHRHLVRKLVLVDPLGPRVPRPLATRLAQLPGLGETLVNLFPATIFSSQLPKDFYKPENCPPEFRKRFLEQAEFPGYKRALLSTIRHWGDMPQPYRRVGEFDVPVLLIWGKADRTIPFNSIQTTRQAIPQAELHVIEQAGHVPHYERPEIVNPLLLNYLVK